MKRLLLCLLMLVVALPLVVYLVAVSGAQPGRKSLLPTDDPKPLVSDDGELPSARALEQLARDEPVAFVEACIRRYQREVKGYTCTMQKQERIKGRLGPKEIIEVAFREDPYSVFLRWIENPRKAEQALYVKGENNDMVLVHPTGLAGRFVKVVERQVDGADAKESGRYTLNNFGIKNGMLRTLKGWKAAKERGKLDVAYLGNFKIKEAGDRTCYKLRRTYDQPENDGVTELTAYVDTENWLQVGSVVKGEGGKLIGEYFFRDIQLNPAFKKDQFERTAVAP